MINDFNPLKWQRNELTAMIIKAILSGSLGIIIGYVVYAIPRGAEGGISFNYWFSKYRWIWWAIFGAIYGYLDFLYKKLIGR